MSGPSIKPAIMVLTILNDDFEEQAKPLTTSNPDKVEPKEEQLSLYAQIARRVSMEASQNGALHTAQPAEEVPVAMCTLELWRAEGLTAVVELDRRLAIKRTDAVAALLFGLPGVGLVKTPLTQ